MADALAFTPLFPNETESAILQRMREAANEGLNPALDPEQWVDTREGSFWYIAAMPLVRELARLWDAAGTEVPAAGFVKWSWGEYLDDHAESRGIERLASTPATGEVRFSGPEGTPIPAGVIVSVDAPTPDAEDVPEFEVLTTTVIGISGVVDLAIRATQSGVAGNVGPGAIVNIQTFIADGVTVTNEEKTNGGTEAQNDDALRTRIELDYEVAGWNAAKYMAVLRSFDGVGRVTVIPHGQGPGSVVGIISTADGDAVSADVVAFVQATMDPPSWQDTIAGPQPLPAATITVQGSTVGLRDEGIARIGNQALQYTGKTSTTLTGVTGGTGTIADGTKVSQSGAGAGRAPIGHHVFILTAAALPITISAAVACAPGYSLTGGDGTLAIGPALQAAVARYVATVQPGEEITIAKVIAAIGSSPGVTDVDPDLVLINGDNENLTVPLSPPQVPAVPVTTLTAM